LLTEFARISLPSRARAAYLGPIAPRAVFGRTPLSWFETPLGQRGGDPLGSAIEQSLSMPQAYDEKHTLDLIQRVLRSDAFHLRNKKAQLPDTERIPAGQQRILVFDERIATACAPGGRSAHRQTTFRAMLHDILAAHPGAEIWLAPSSDPGHGAWLSSNCDGLPPGTRRLEPNYSLHAWLPHFDSIYTLGASEGMAAVLANRATYVYGRPYYAGWGFTNDRETFEARRARPSLAAWFDTVFIQLACYLDLETNLPGALDRALDTIELQHDVAERFAHLGHVAGVRFQWWKRRLATPYLTAGGGTLRWANDPASLGAHECAALWGARSTDGLPPGSRYCRIEDGFIHSAELGSDMSPPHSQVIDGSNLYFDASAPSDLTGILNTATFDTAELDRANRLRNDIIELGITKYNLGRRHPSWSRPKDRLVVLVPGQVADDASIRLGTGSINTADGLLAAARARRPDAFIVYKPHPDVLSGNRNGLVHARQFADIVDTEADIVSLIESSDEIHTLSSLAGFDALLRGKAVFTYGMPFYAGWGLTDDAIHPQPWRNRPLTLNMLTAGALIRYPVYWNWRQALYTTPEAVIRLLAPAARRPLRSLGHSRTRMPTKIFRWMTNALVHIWWRYRQMRAEAEAAVVPDTSNE
jgi:capsular polysaccharide export protein